MHDNTPSVADSLADRSHYNNIGKEVRFISRPKEKLHQSTDGKYGNEEGIQSKIRRVPVDSVFD